MEISHWVDLLSNPLPGVLIAVYFMLLARRYARRPPSIFYQGGPRPDTQQVGTTPPLPRVPAPRATGVPPAIPRPPQRVYRCPYCGGGFRVRPDRCPNCGAPAL